MVLTQLSSKKKMKDEDEAKEREREMKKEKKIIKEQAGFSLIYACVELWRDVYN